MLIRTLFIALITACFSAVAHPEVASEVQPHLNRHKPLAASNFTQTMPTSIHHGYAFYPGSLKENISQLAHQCGWLTVIWQPPYDYQWVGITHFAHKNIKKILNDVLSRLPLQAIFYEGNHVLVIAPRNLA